MGNRKSRGSSREKRLDFLTLQPPPSNPPFHFCPRIGEFPLKIECKSFDMKYTES